MAGFAKEVASVLENIGLTTVIIPFALTFIIMFSVLQRTKVLGRREGNKPKTKLNAVFSCVIGFIVIAYADTVQVFNRVTQYGVVLLIAGLIIAMVMAFSGFPGLKKLKIFRALGLIAFCVFAFYALGAFELIDISKIQSNIIIPLIAVVTFIVVVYIIIKPSKGKPSAKKPSKKEETPVTPEEIPV